MHRNKYICIFIRMYAVYVINHVEIGHKNAVDNMSPWVYTNSILQVVLLN